MIEKLLRLIGSHLSEVPFTRPHWWSKRYISYIEVYPPLTKENPLWKRSQDELTQIRLFNKSPEELGRAVEDYLKESRWKRWFIFGMKKKVHLWNYYRRCLIYKLVIDGISKIIIEDQEFCAEIQHLLDDVINYSYKHYLKFFAYSSCEGENYDYFKDSFRHRDAGLCTTAYLKKKLIHLSVEDHFLLNQNLREKSYFFYINEIISIIYNRKVEDLTRLFRLFKELEKKESSNKVVNLSETNEVFQVRLRSLDNKKEWVKIKRKELTEFFINKEPNQVLCIKTFLETTFAEIINTIESHFLKYDSMVDHFNNYKQALNELTILHRQIKLILRNAVLLFHPDHILNLTDSEKITSLITEYSQQYNHKYDSYVERLEIYQNRLEEEGDWLEEEGQLPPKELEKIIQIIEKFLQSLQEMKTEHKQHQAAYFDKKNEYDLSIEDLMLVLNQYYMKLTGKNKHIFVKSIKKITEMQAKKEAWLRILKARIEEFKVNEKSAINLSKLEKTIDYIVINIDFIKEQFLGSSIFSNEHSILGHNLLRKIHDCDFKKSKFNDTEKKFLTLQIKELKVMKRCFLLSKLGLQELKEKFPYREDADLKEKELKNKFHNLNESFFIMKKQYDNNEFDSPMPKYRNTM